MISIVKGEAEIPRNLPGLSQCWFRDLHFLSGVGGAIKHQMIPKQGFHQSFGGTV